jgi:hypothetical protein
MTHITQSQLESYLADSARRGATYGGEPAGVGLVAAVAEPVYLDPVQRSDGRLAARRLCTTGQLFDAVAQRGQPILSLVSRVFLRERKRIIQQLTDAGHLGLLYYALHRWLAVIGLVYQTLACRMWARSRFYQSGGRSGSATNCRTVRVQPWTRRPCFSRRGA